MWHLGIDAPLAYLTRQQVSARSVPLSRIRILSMNNCWANAYLRAKPANKINVHAPGTADDAARDSMRIALVQLILRSRTSKVPAIGGNVGLRPIRPTMWATTSTP